MSIFKYFFHGVPAIVAAPRPAVRPSPAVVLLVDESGSVNFVGVPDVANPGGEVQFHAGVSVTR